MNEILDAIERQFVSGLRRRQLRRRRRRTTLLAAAIGAVALVAAGAGVAAITETPIDRVLNGSTPSSRAQGAARIDMTLTDSAGVRWTMTTYRATNGTLSSTVAADGLSELPSVGGASGFVLADALLDGPLSGLGLTSVRTGEEDHYLVSGTVDATARTVAVLIGDKRFDATLAENAVTLPVEKPNPDEMTAAGRARADRMPSEVTLRPFAVALPPGLLAGVDIAPAMVAITLEDGTHYLQHGPHFCVSRSCGARIPTLN